MVRQTLFCWQRTIPFLPTKGKALYLVLRGAWWGACPIPGTCLSSYSTGFANSGPCAPQLVPLHFCQQGQLFASLDRGNVRLIFPFALLMLIAWLGNRFGLATIIGAFAAGLIIEEEYFPREAAVRGTPSVASLMGPIQVIFAPIFFVLIGLRVDVATFANLKVLLMGLVLVAIILAAKVASALPVKKEANRLVVAAGRLPRGEVSLIFAGVGKSLGLLNDNLYSVIIIVMLLTTLLTPPLLKFALETRAVKKTA